MINIESITKVVSTLVAVYFLVDRKEISGPDGGPVSIAIPQELTVEEGEKKFG